MKVGTREGESRRIFFRAALLLSAGAFALFGALGIWLETQVRQIVVEDRELLAAAIASAAASRVRPLLVSEDYDGVAITLESVAEDTGAVDLLVASNDGSVISRITRTASATNRLVERVGGRVDPPAKPGAMQHVDGQLQAWGRVDGAADAGWVRATIALAPAWGRFDAFRKYAEIVAALGGLILFALLISPLAWTYRLVERRESGLLAERDELHHAVYHDRLTGLCNRLGLLERLQSSLASRRASDQLLAVCFLDLDGFKAVNDRYGHAVGDLLLVEVGRRLSACVRHTDTVARLGGDEFVLLLEGENRPGELLGILEGVIARISQRVPAAGKPLRVGVSIGVALRYSGDDTAESLLKQADEAMYEAKRGGRNRWVLHQSARGLLFNPPDPSAPVVA